MRWVTRKRVSITLVAIALSALGGCDKGTAVVTLTASQLATGLDSGAATPRNFLAYRVKLDSIAMTTADGKTAVQFLPASTTVDLAQLVDVSEVLGAASAAMDSYARVAVTFDYSGAQIVVDDGSLNGAALTPVDASGAPLGQVALSSQLDPHEALRIARSGTSRLALDIALAASNTVDLAQKTVTVTPMLVASALPIDAKTVRIIGPLARVDTAQSSYDARIQPFDGQRIGGGQLSVAAGGATVYEVNGVPATGALGLARLSALSAGSSTAAYGSLNSADGSASASDVVFAAAQVLAGSSVQSTQFDRISGVVAARAGDTVIVPAATLTTSAGVNSYLTRAASVQLGAGTALTLPAQGSATVGNTIAQVSVGSRITAFGVASTDGAGNAALDATAGRVRLAASGASGLVGLQGNGTLMLALATLGERAVAPLNFLGTGAAASGDSNPNQYVVTAGGLALANATAGSPVEASGLVAPFGATPPDFAASTLLDQTTIPALFAIDWGAAGAVSPFASTGSSAIDLNIHDAAIGTRHRIMVGAQTIDVTTLPSDVLIVPNGASAALVFAIGHATTTTIDDFDTFAAFVSALQTDLNGATAATALTADGQYTAATRTLAANSITVYLND